MPPRKKHKLGHIVGLRGVSDAALHDILKVIREDPALFLDDAFSIATVQRAAFGLLDEIGEDIEMPTVDGKGFKLRIAPLQTLLP